MVHGDWRRGLILVGNLEEAAERAARWLVEKTPIRTLRDWATSFSLWPVHLTTSCCGAEFAALYAPKYDAERLGSLPFTHPRNTNLMLIEGTLTRKMARVARITWEQMPWPKFVIAMGACAFTGGLFYNSYNIVLVQDVLPVDYYVPGCPPPPEAVADALIKLQKKVREGKWRPRDVEDKGKLEELMQPVYTKAERYRESVVSWRRLLEGL
ncbi:NADH-ubiquinone oxidoreductase chain K [Pyrodictium delaneyi]|uniref:NADH-quinone oxidoreductase subunit B n=1 Tax=Pyrodictium delaneyi TaxID=1273541 RepID=A0A0P0N496_9CREN|nr:NADH-quinone oxidoreductase subunit NuoB [Pyrodictium delaneyi]ALL01516.1 NADH-ubiquinone oxidoreductase chain K [Pyrodictium delaneyi]OWJ54580.1 NADH-quinone oxidoreductase subunit B [Pyrodictium delaneyi]